MFTRIRWRIALPYVLLIVLVLGGLSLYLSAFLRASRLEDLRGQLLAQCRLVGDALREPLAKGQPPEAIDALTLQYAGIAGARLTVIAVDGTVLGDSYENRLKMDNHLLRPEVQAALARDEGTSLRFSNTLHYDMLYGAVAVRQDGHIVGIVRLALPVRQIDVGVAHLRSVVFLATLLATLLAILLAIAIAERTSRPVQHLTEAFRQVSKGDLGVRILSSSRDEVGVLTRSFNEMLERQQKTIVALDREQTRLAAILERMADGVLITDSEARITLANPAAMRLLGHTREDALRHTAAQVLRDHRLIALRERALAQNEELAEVVELPKGPALQVIVTPLGQGTDGGCLIVLQDLTRMRRLETVRRDFVSNISHELRTPLASLKALVETLRDGALEDPPAAARFLDRMEVEVDALTQMVEELLELSRIESGRVPLRLAPASVAEIVVDSVERLRSQAERANLSLTVAFPPDLPLVLADVSRVQRVVTNLVHNAIKFTPAGGKVDVTAQNTSDEMVITVRDTGVGIPEADLPRVFERFYKVDRARHTSGTGLGLAIARHVVESHGGRIWVESVEGRGSAFFFTLPLAKAEGGMNR